MIRIFSNREGHGLPTRTLEDAPVAMRQELIDLFFGVVEHQPHPPLLRTDHIYQVICQSLGIQADSMPHAGFRHAAGYDIGDVAWPRVYDLISRLWPEYQRVGLQAEFLEGVNRILAGFGSAWELRADGSMHRVLPLTAQRQVEGAFAELEAARYAPALALLTAASAAYDERPRRNRDACSNVFDAMESVAKERYGMPNATFRDVLTHLRRVGGLNAATLGIMEAINNFRNRNFGHGMVEPFNPGDPEVDFFFLTCVGAVLLFTRTA